MYKEEDYLALSGIQHYSFCKRQWALIHLEQIWEDDARTASGKVFHERVDEPSRESRGDLLIVRGVRVSSSNLGFSGVCDVVEFRRTEEGYEVDGMEGLYAVSPVEYKVGHRKTLDCDRLQLCAEAMALEETLHTHVDIGFLFYGKERRRERVEIDEVLRATVLSLATEMHESFESGRLPPATIIPYCKRCSLADHCIPSIPADKSVSRYLSSMEEQ